MKRPQVRALFERMLTAALTAVDPFEAVRQAVTRTGLTIQVGKQPYDLNRYTRIFAIGAGKASARMAVALEQRLGTRLTGGAVVVKYGHSTPTSIIDIQEA
ncbi:MAG TPA: DUF4147 domain-containing protein, partial [Nitrospiraceae bacterium]|nr:DUF4147 domain-containing protein [Nitrospiraceae bacterium]